jgi:hypothetical protein
VPDKPRLGEQLGYLSRELAEKLAPQMDNGNVLLGGLKQSLVVRMVVAWGLISKSRNTGRSGTEPQAPPHLPDFP